VPLIAGTAMNGTAGYTAVEQHVDLPRRRYRGTGGGSAAAAAPPPSNVRSAWPAREIAAIETLAHCGVRVSERPHRSVRGRPHRPAWHGRHPRRHHPLSSAWRPTTATSSAGTPRISNTTRSGSSHVSYDTISARPSWSRSAMKRRTRSRRNGSRPPPGADRTRPGQCAWCGCGPGVDVGQCRDRPEPALGQGPAGGWARRGDRRQRVGGREHVVAPA
jgi:hypothetical protein